MKLFSPIAFLLLVFIKSLFSLDNKLIDVELHSEVKEKTELKKHWNIDVLLSMVENKSLAILSEKEKTYASREGTVSSQYDFIPEVSLSLTYDDYAKIAKILRYSEPNPYEVYRYGVNLKLPLYDGFKKYHSLKYAELNERLSNAKLNQVIEEYQIKMIDAYYNHLGLHMQLNLLKETESLFMKLTQVSKQKLDAKAMSRLNFLDMTLKEKNFQIRLMSIKQEYKNSLNELSAVLNVKTSFWDKHSFPQCTQPKQKELLYDVASTSNRSKVLKSQLTAEEYKKNITRSGFKPTISLITQWDSKALDRYRSNHDNSEYSVSLSFDWSLSQIFKTRQQLKSDEFKNRSLELKWEQSLLDSVNQRKQLQNKLEQLKREVELRESMLTQQNYKLDLAKEDFGKGLLDQSRFIQYEIDYNESKIQVKNSIVEYCRNFKKLELLIK